MIGHAIAVLVQDETQRAGTHQVTFRGHGLPSGVYFCRLQANRFSQTRRLLLLERGSLLPKASTNGLIGLED